MEIHQVQVSDISLGKTNAKKKRMFKTGRMQKLFDNHGGTSFLHEDSQLRKKRRKRKKTFYGKRYRNCEEVEYI